METHVMQGRKAAMLSDNLILHDMKIINATDISNFVFWASQIIPRLCISKIVYLQEKCKNEKLTRSTDRLDDDLVSLVLLCLWRCFWIAVIAGTGERGCLLLNVHIATETLHNLMYSHLCNIIHG